MASTAATWRDRAAISALVAGAVAVVVLLLEGPPGNGYGWGSVSISVVVVAALFMLMAYLVRDHRAGRAAGAAAVAVLLVVMFTASLIGNWGFESAASRVLDTISTVLTVAVGCAVFVVAMVTVRHARSSHSHTVL